MLEVRNVTRLFGQKAALDNVSFSVSKSAFVGIIGRPGAGKSTLRVMNRLTEWNIQARRGGSHSGNVAAMALAEADLLDIVSSDYVPSSLLTAALILWDVWGNLARGIATVTAAPAEATGLDYRGHLAIGSRADVIRVRRLEAAAAVHGVWVHGQRVG